MNSHVRVRWPWRGVRPDAITDRDRGSDRTVLYSRSANVALAHYPKAAGSSLAIWFKARFPDATPSDPLDPHDPVRRSLKRHGLLARRPANQSLRILLRPARRLLRPEAAGAMPLVIGVLREPFDLLVSLYRFWNRRFSVKRYPTGTLPHAAGTGSFRVFLERAVVAGEICTYQDFFDIGGPAWQRTRLLDFRAIEAGLGVVCRELDIAPPADLPACNVAPSRPDEAAFLAEAGGLTAAVRRHFQWYYEEAAAVLLRPLAEPAVACRVA
ncbi:MAG: hypothetical protein FJ284_02595 [Planctomycetes bacterium]|nr:hypothetical protein [Planctomycetota bacterium]